MAVSLLPETLNTESRPTDSWDMWKRTDSHIDTVTTPEVSSPTATATPSSPSATQTRSASPAGTATLGQSIVITGELRGNEDFTVEGRLEGTIELKQHTVTIGANATAKAQITAKDVVVLGKVVGNITATAKVEIRPNGTVEGDIVSPTVAISEGAVFRGSIDMSGSADESAA